MNKHKIMADLLQRFNDYDTPIQMTAGQARDIIEDYFTEEEVGSGNVSLGMTSPDRLLAVSPSRLRDWLLEAQERAFELDDESEMENHCYSCGVSFVRGFLEDKIEQ